MLNNTNDPVMEKAVRIIYDMSEDTAIRENARLREKALHDEASLLGASRREGIKIGRLQGLQQGLQQGLRQGREEAIETMIKNMRLVGMSDEAIRKIVEGDK